MVNIASSKNWPLQEHATLIKENQIQFGNKCVCISK